MNLCDFKQSVRKHWFVWLASMVLLLVGTGVYVLLWFQPSPKVVTISGSSTSLGAEYGRAFRPHLKLLTRVYLDRIVCQNNPTLITSRRSKALEGLKHWSLPYAEELAAAAQASGVETGALAYGNSFLDLGNTRAGCRSAVVASSNAFLHAHNLDWDNLGGLGRWTTCIVRRHPTDGRLATVAVGFPGLIGALDIINEKGLALSFNQLGVGRGDVTEPVLIMIRRVAETCSSLNQARREILNAPPGMPFIITVSAARPEEASIFERARDPVVERPLTNGWAAACNVAQNTTPGATRLDQLLAESPIGNEKDLQRVLSHPEVLMACNIYSVIFDFRHNRLLVASGKIPAAAESFRSFLLFP